MRKDDITPELIELSRKAKELGFPQDVEEGDWYCVKVDEFDNPFFLYLTHDDSPQLEDLDDACLILSFSRCLEWFQIRRWWLKECGNYWSEDESGHWRYVVEAKKEQSFQVARCNAYTHHEAIAKAVVKILEEEK